MPMVSSDERGRNRTALMDAARELLVARGTRASLPAIAEAAGLTTGAIYSIFGSRGGMFAAILEDDFRRLFESFQALEDDALALPDVLEGIARRFLTARGEDPMRQLGLETELWRLAAADERLARRLRAVKVAEHERLAALLAGRRIAPGTRNTTRRTTPAEAWRLAITVAALLAGFYQSREQVPGEVTEDLILDAVAALAKSIPARAEAL